jgi:hypothetical protein
MPTRDASSPARVLNTTAGQVHTWTTAAFSPPAQSWLYLHLGYNGGNPATPTLAKPTNTGAPLVWELFSSINNASGGGCAVWRARCVVAQIGVSATASITWSSSAGVSNSVAAWLEVITGADFDQSGAAAATSTSAVQTNNPTVTTTRSGSRGVGVVIDWAATGAPTSSDTIDAYTVAANTSGGRAYKAADSGAPGSVALNFVSGGAAPINSFIVYEILAGGGWPTGSDIASRRRRRPQQPLSDVFGLQRISAAQWFDSAIAFTDSAPAGVGLSAALADEQDAAASTLAAIVGASAVIADASDAASSAFAAAVILTSSIADQQDAAAAFLSIQSGLGLSSTLADQSDGITAALSAVTGLSGTAQDERDRATATLAAAAGLSASLTDEQDRATSSLSALVNLSEALLDEQDRISSTVVIGSAPLTVNAAIVDAQDGAASAFSVVAGLSAALADQSDQANGAFSVAVGLTENAADETDRLIASLVIGPSLVTLNAAIGDAQDGAQASLATFAGLAQTAADEADRVIAALVAGVSINAGLTDGSDPITSDLSISPIGGLALTASLFDDSDTLISSLSISDAPAPSGGADGNSSWGSTGGGLLHKFKLAQAFKDKQEREEAVRRLPKATQAERVVLRRAAVKLLRQEPVNYKELENRVTADLNAAGLQAAPHHLDWLLFMLRVEAHVAQQRAQTLADEEAVISLLLAVME